MLLPFQKQACKAQPPINLKHYLHHYTRGPSQGITCPDASQTQPTSMLLPPAGSTPPPEDWGLSCPLSKKLVWVQVQSVPSAAALTASAPRSLKGLLFLALEPPGGEMGTVCPSLLQEQVLGHDGFMKQEQQIQLAHSSVPTKASLTPPAESHSNLHSCGAVGKLAPPWRCFWSPSRLEAGEATIAASGTWPLLEEQNLDSNSWLLWPRNQR